MSPEHIRIVQSTWTKLLPVKGVAAHLFAERLLDTDPSLACLDARDPRAQGERLMQLIGAAVQGLNRLNRDPALMRRAMRRYAGCPVSDRQYASIGAALVWTLGKCLDAEFTADAKNAWISVFGELAGTMRSTVVAARSPIGVPVRGSSLGDAP